MFAFVVFWLLDKIRVYLQCDIFFPCNDNFFIVVSSSTMASNLFPRGCGLLRLIVLFPTCREILMAAPSK